MWMCHDYQPKGRELRYVTSVEEQSQSNSHVGNAVSENDYVKVREERDAGLSVPKLIYPALQVNIQAGRLPNCDENGRRLFKLPATINNNWG